MQVLSEEPETLLAAAEEDSTPVKSTVKSAEEMSKEHADAVELLNQLTTDEPMVQNSAESEQPTTPTSRPASEEKEASKIKRKVSH